MMLVKNLHLAFNSTSKGLHICKNVWILFSDAVRHSIRFASTLLSHRKIRNDSISANVSFDFSAISSIFRSIKDKISRHTPADFTAFRTL